MAENMDIYREKLTKFLVENEVELSKLSKEDRDLAIFQEGYIAGLERAINIVIVPTQTTKI